MITDLIAGRVRFAFEVAAAILPFAGSGQVKLLGVASLERTPAALEFCYEFMKREREKWAPAIISSGAQVDWSTRSPQRQQAVIIAGSFREAARRWNVAVARALPCLQVQRSRLETPANKNDAGG